MTGKPNILRNKDPCLPTLRPQCPVNPLLSKIQNQHKPGNQVPIPSKTPGIPPLFPFGLPKPTCQVTRRLTPFLKSTSQGSRDYLRAVLHRARNSVPIKPVLSGTLRAMAMAALPQPAASPYLPAFPLTSTHHPQKRKRTHSSVPTFRGRLFTDCSITEPESEPSLPPSPEQLR